MAPFPRFSCPPSSYPWHIFLALLGVVLATACTQEQAPNRSQKVGQFSVTAVDGDAIGSLQLQDGALCYTGPHREAGVHLHYDELGPHDPVLADLASEVSNQNCKTITSQDDIELIQSDWGLTYVDVHLDQTTLWGRLKPRG